MINEIFKKMCEIRYFDLEVIKAHKKGLIHCPIYLSAGQEAVAASLSVTCSNYTVFLQHRAHSWYLAFGGDPIALRDEILGRTTGCCGGNGGSSDIQCDRVINHHGLMGEQVPMGVGYALATKHPVIIQAGDGSVEEDCYLTSVGFAVTHKLPVLFICEDNGFAILTPIKARRNWNIVDAVKGMGMNALDIEDDPEQIINLNVNLPALVNIRTTRHNWHVGSGQDKIPDQDRLVLCRTPQNTKIELEAKRRMEKIWQL